jgi:hypothetical protein
MPVSPRARVARNFVARYGEPALRRLLDLLADGASGQVIAQELGVTRERVRQWKNTFGTEVTVYQVHPEIARLLASAEPSDAAGIELVLE